MSIVSFPKKIRAPGQKITKAHVNYPLVIFLCDKDILFHAPFRCILNLIQRIREGLPVECKEPQGTDVDYVGANYVGAVMKIDRSLVVRLRHKVGKQIKYEDISIRSLLRIGEKILKPEKT